MKRVFKQIIASLLTVVMLLTAAPLSGFVGLELPDFSSIFSTKAEAATFEAGDLIEFGSYPQGMVSDLSLITSLNSLSLNWISYDYYSGNGDRLCPAFKSSDYMRYADVTFKGEKYRAVKFSEYRPYDNIYPCSESESYQDDNGYALNTVYWFKYEPLLWSVLDPDSGLLICESIIDAQAYSNIQFYNPSAGSYIVDCFFNDAACTIYSSDYEYSSIRTWLNNDFYYTAFSSEEMKKITVSELDNRAYYSQAYPNKPQYDSNTTNDKVFLLSLDEAIDITGDRSFSIERMKKSTEYAKIQGLYGYDTEAWLLRTPGNNSCTSAMVDFQGSVTLSTDVTCIEGIVPAIKVGSNFCDNEIVTGTCGDNLIWKLDLTTGELIISGEGEMDDYNYASLPWCDYRLDIKTVTIGEGVTSIGTYAFSDCQYMTYVILPDTITAIGGEAFFNCVNLLGVNLGNNVKTIGLEAFYNCCSISFVEIPDSVTYIYQLAFARCSNLENVIIGSNVTAIGAQAFSFCDKLVNVLIPASVTFIGEGVFGECNSLKSITVEANNTNYSSDSYGVLYNNSKTKLIQYPVANNRTEFVVPGSVNTIGKYAFVNSNNLVSVTLNKNLTTINEASFYSCDKLSDVYYGGTEDMWKNIKIEAYNDSLLNARIHYNSAIAVGNACGDNLTWSLNLTTGELVISGTGYMYNYTSEEKAPWYEDRSSIKSVVISEDVNSVGDLAFIDCYFIESVSLPESLNSIGKYAFMSCNNLTGVYIPDGVTSLGIGAFNACEKLAHVYLPESITLIPGFAFYYCGLISVVIPEGVTEIGLHAFTFCSDLSEITVPKSVTSIGGAAFQDCTLLSDVYYCGTEKDWYKIEISESYNESLLNATIHFLGEDEECQHNYISSITTQPTCTSTGVMTYTCSICGDKYTETISKNPHNYSHIVVPSTCKVAGMEYDICSECGEVANSKVLPLADHKLKNTVIKSTCTENGKSYDTCTVCGGVFNSKVLPLADHTYSYIVVPSTCTVAGMRYDICSECGDIANVEVLPLADHTLKHTVIESTCTEKGESYDTCTVCGGVFNSKVLPLADHTYSYIVVPSTCTVAGMRYDICSECGDIANVEVLPLAEHTLKHTVIESTCTEKGKSYDTCMVCGGTFNTKYLPLAPHTWGEWATVREATAELEGLKQRKCTVCTTTEDEVIPKLQVVVDDDSGIKVEFGDEFDSDIELSVEEVFDGGSFQLLDLNYGNNQAKIYDINTIKDGVKVQPDGSVKVKVPLPTGFSTKNIYVCYVDSANGTVINIPAKVVDGYVEFEAEHFSYYAVVEKLGKVNSVSVNNVTMNYKDSTTITPSVNADAGVKYTVSYSSSNESVARVDSNGNVTATGKGNATITVTVTDEYGNTVTDTCNVEVKYSWWQWIIVIVLFGWIWY